ncbi:MAG: rhomboid family intramembrane serine protease [Candidatus Paceibacterota bacterium]|jgi:membrane associated rhomboid family serine protease
MIPLCDEKRIGRFPFAVVLLIVINTIIFLSTYPNLEYYVGLFGFSSGKLFDGQFFTVFTSMFLHVNFLHLISNMWFLWVFGSNLEARLGSLKFLAFYLLCGLGAGIVYALAMVNPDTAVIGASGAISGVLGGYLVLFPRSRIRTFFITFFSVPAVIYIFLWFVYQLFSATTINTPVAYWGHLGGFVSGLLFIRFFRR